MTNPTPSDPSGPTAPGQESVGDGEQLLDAGAAGSTEELPAAAPEGATRDAQTAPQDASEGRTGEAGQGLAD